MYWELKRGGYIVQVDTEKTKYIQFGMPPETIKDAMNIGIDVPTTFVIFGDFFDCARGLSIENLSFLYHYNFFVKKKR